MIVGIAAVIKYKRVCWGPLLDLSHICDGTKARVSEVGTNPWLGLL